MDKKNSFMYKDIDFGRKELFSMLIYRPIANMLLFAFLKRSKITPNQISFASLLLTIAACCFFAFFAYPYSLFGLVFLHANYVFDCLDGQYARYKGLTSKFGRWFDPFMDIMKAALLFISLSHAAYMASGNPRAILWGMVAMANSLLTYYIMNTKGVFVKEATFEMELGKNTYIGYEVSLYWALSIIASFNILYKGLIFMATVGSLSWIKLYITARHYYVKNMESIENPTE